MLNLRYSLRPNARGQTPYIELDGVQYPDSNLIIDLLKTERSNLVGADPEEEAGVDEDGKKLALGHMAK